MIIAFTGSRPNKLGGYKTPNPIFNKVCKGIEKYLIELQPEKIISGMAQGTDIWAAKIAVKLKIPFIAAIPFIGQESIWPASSQEEYHSLLKLAAKQVIVSKGTYSAEKMQVRNQWMVDNSDLLIAVWDGSSGGTANCVKYAKSKNKTIMVIDPK